MRTIKSNQGFTLVELMVSLVVAGVVLAGICSTFYSQHISYLNQEQIVSMQQNLRAAMYIDLPPVFVPVFKLELNPILKCFVSTEVVES